MGKFVSKALRIGSLVAGVALAIPSSGTSLLAATLGVKAGVATGIAAGLSLGASLLSGASVPKSAVQLGRLNATLDPRAARKMVLSRTAMPLDLRYYEGSGEDERTIEYIGVCAAHRIQGFEELWIEDELAWSASGGIEPQFTDYLGVEGFTEGGPAATRAINGGARWGSDDRLTGCAYLYLRVERLGASEGEQSPFANGLPGRVTVIGTGMQEYDPRFDDTAGGSGTQRADQQDTWGPSTGNPIIEALNVLLGWRINGKLSVGAGIPAKYIDMQSVITAANICDEPIALAAGGTQPRYRAAGAFSTADAPMDIVASLLAACGGDLLDANGKLSFLIKANTLANPAVTLGEKNLLSVPRWEPMGGQASLPNVISGSFTDPGPNALYQLVPYPSVTLPSEDGIERTAPLDFGPVENSPQAERLAKQTLQRMQYPGRWSAEYDMLALAATVGRIVYINHAPLGFAAKPFRVVSQRVSRTGRIALVLAEENTAIYAWAAEDTAPVQPAAPVAFGRLNSSAILLAREAGKTADWPNVNDTDGTKPDPNATRQVGRGTYSSASTYLRGDRVRFNGSTYELIVASSTGNAPPDGVRWNLDAEAGSGPAGDDGLPGLTIFLDNPNPTIATAADGTGGDYSAAGGTFLMLRGTDLVEPTFSVAAKTPTSNWITIDAVTGEYTVTDPGVDDATATLRAVWAGVPYDLTYRATKAKQGTFDPVDKAKLDTIEEGATNTAESTVNLLPFTKFEGGQGWGTSGDVTAEPVKAVVNNRTYIRALPVFTADAQNLFLFSTPRIAVREGQRFSVSAQIDAFALSGPEPGDWQLYFEYYDGVGAIVSSTLLSGGVGNAPSAQRFATFSTAPSDGSAQLVLYTQSDGAGSVQMGILEPMVAEASATQTVHPPYAPGPAVGEIGQLNEIDLADTSKTTGQLPKERAALDLRNEEQRYFTLPDRPLNLGQLDGAANAKLDGIENGAQVNPASLAALDSTASSKLDGIEPNAQVNPLNLLALDPAQDSKLNGIEPGAQVNPANLAALDQAAADKLNGIEPGATAGGGPATGFTNASGTNGFGTGSWTRVLRLTLTAVPGGRLIFNSFNIGGQNKCVPSTVSGNETFFEAQLRLEDDTTIRELRNIGPRKMIENGGTVAFGANFNDLFTDPITISATGTLTIDVETRRTSGTGSVLSSNTEMDVTIEPNFN